MIIFVVVCGPEYCFNTQIFNPFNIVIPTRSNLSYASFLRLLLLLSGVIESYRLKLFCHDVTVKLDFVNDYV